MHSCMDTNSSVYRESQFKRPAVFPNHNDPYPSIRYERTSPWARLTWDRELVLGGAPIFIEERLKVDKLTPLSVLRPK